MDPMRFGKHPLFPLDDRSYREYAEKSTGTSRDKRTYPNRMKLFSDAHQHSEKNRAEDDLSNL